MKNSVVAVLTDFGWSTWYTGVMKAVILDINPSARIIDLCHDISKQDIREACFVIGTSFGYFPKGTTFVCVIDPGVGGKRKNIIVKTEDYFFVAPDNGVLSSIYEKSRVEGVFEVFPGEYTGNLKGSTFLGRDLFSPIGAHLSLGVSPSEMGEPVESIMTISPDRPFIDRAGRIVGRAAYVDSYGNIITNISNDYLMKVFRGAVPWKDIKITISGRELGKIRRYYAEGKRGELMALVNSWGHLEVAVNCGSAFVYLGYSDKESIVVNLSSSGLAGGKSG